MCNYEQVIEQDVKDALRNHYDYGDISLEQFWALEGESICNDVYEAVSLILQEKANLYTKLIGSDL